MRDNYRPDIEGLRCIAVLSVIFFHAGYSSFVSGFVGVDVFFVISGFLITSGIYNGISQGNFSVIDFFNRRFWRIQPLLLVLMLATTCYWYFNATPDDIIKFLASLKSLSLFSSNQYFGSLDFGYFSDNTDIMPLLHTWSLSIEWQWYFLLPFILVLLANDFGRRALPWVMLAGLLLMTYLGLRPSGEDDAVRYYSFSMRVFALIAGALVATIDIKTIANKIPYWLNTLLSLSFLSLLIHMSQTKKAIPAYPNLYGLIAVSMTVLLIILGSSERKTAIFKVMAFKPFVLIGLLSYSLYIWHWPIFAAYRYKSVYMSASTVVLLLLASLLAAVLSYKLLENPMRKLYKKVPLTITLIILVFVPITFAHLLDSKVMANSIAKNPNDAIQIEWRNKNAQIADCQDPDDLSEEYLAQCAFGTAGKKNSVLVIGDSWSDHFVLMVDHILKDAGRAGYHLTTSNDSPFLDDRGIAGKGPINQINFAAIKANQYDYVVIGNSLSRDYKHNKAIGEHLFKTVDFIVEHGAAPVFIVGLYDRVHKSYSLKGSDYDYTRCGFTIFDDRCEFEDNMINNGDELAVREILQSIQEKYPQTVIIDIHDFLCADGKCSATIDGYPVYRDVDGHITPYASNRLGEMYLQTHANPFKKVD